VSTERDPQGLEWREVHQGAHPGDQFVRIARHRAFRKLGAGRYEVRASRNLPSGLGGLYTRLKRLVIGEPLATAAAGHERLTKVKALAVLSSDALSSVAYATEQIMRMLLVAGAAALGASLGIGAVLVVLLFVVGFSYRQTIKAYPTGGGSYIVAKDNLGTLPGLTAAASLLISYTLTVAVSVAAGVLALSSAYPVLAGYSAEIGVAVIILITLVNLRGIRESGSVFMLPTYFFLLCVAALLIWGLVRYGFGPTAEPQTTQLATEGLTLFLMLRAFASGGAALTGVEAISDGVPAFRPPEWINAQKTLTAMVVILAITFSGITYLANRMGMVPGDESETVVSLIARGVFGDSPFYYAVQYSTFLILFLAANTAYSDFPRLAYFLGRDRFLPRQFTLPRRSPGVLGGYRGAGRSVVDRALEFWRQHRALDSAVRLRRVQRVHAVAGGHGHALVAAARTGLAAQHHFQRRRRVGHVRRLADRRHDQIRRRCMDGGGDLAAAHPDVPRHQCPLQSGRCRASRGDADRPGRDQPSGHRPDRLTQSGGVADVGVCALHRA
jgi:hypothetical protein